PAIRVLDMEGRGIAELWDGPGLGLEPVAWSLVAGDQRLLALHDRRGRSQPLILNATSPAVDDIELDLPGETFADWYPDAKALLIGHEYRGRTELYRYDLGTRALERLPAEPGTIVAARVHPDGDVWYQLTSARTPAATHALSDGVADPKRIILSGGSWGGYLTLMGLGTQPERWSLGIPIVPVGEYLAAYEDEMEPLKKYDDALFGGSPAEVPEKYRESNPITYVEHIRVPMLLIVGQNDPRCPSRSVDIYRERLLELGKKFEEDRFDAGHGSLVVDEQIRQIALQIAFVSRNLGTPEPID